MKNEIFMIDEENGYSLILDTNNDSWYVELLDTEQRVVFHHKCDTFITGNLILHLQKAIERFIKTRNKIVLSRWYPKSDPRFLISITDSTHITPCIYKDKETDECYVKFLVVIKDVEKPIKFKILLKQLQEKLN